MAKKNPRKEKKGIPRIFFFGNGERGISSLRTLSQKKANIVGLATEKEDSLIEMKKYAQKQGVPLFIKPDVKQHSFHQSLKGLSIDWIIVAGFSQIFKKEILGMPKKGVLNLHGGLLPSYRGSSPLNWSLINGEKKAGVSIILMDEGIDSGPIVKQSSFPIDEKDTIKQLHQKANEAFSYLLSEAYEEMVEGKVASTPQDHSKAVYYHARQPQDGKMDFSKLTSAQVHGMIRALSRPYPGAFCFLDGKKCVIWESDQIAEEFRGVAGRVCAKRKSGAVVICKDRGIIIKKVQIEADSEKDASQVLKIGQTLL